MNKDRFFILKRVAMKNKMHCSKQNTADAIRVTGVCTLQPSLRSGSKLHTHYNRCVSSLVMQNTISKFDEW